MADTPPAPTSPPTTCYRHPDRQAGVRCQRCDRHICPSCMTTASVGFHCPECAKAGSQKIHTAGSMFGARPVVTQALLAINVAVFLISVGLGDGFARGAVARDGLLVDGALFGPFVDVEGEWYRIFTSGFLHYGLFHIGFNMYALWIFGPTFERSLGRVRFLLAYMAALLGGAFGALLVSPLSLTAGASGAIFGLLGVAAVSQRSLGLSIWDTGLGTVLLLNFALTFGIGNISVGGHVGGFVVGAAAGWLAYELPRKQNQLPRYAVDVAIGAIGVACFVGALWAAGTWTNPIF